ncbi:hypothetical protein EBZ39_11365 [bacterium]|nr:hypothetical protein [bacterium]
MRILETPYFLRVINDPQRAHKMIEQIVAQIVNGNDSGNPLPISNWYGFIARIENQTNHLDANDLARVAARNFNSALATTCLAADLYYPLVWLNTQRRYIQQRRAMPSGYAEEVLQNEYQSSQGFDRDFLHDFINEWHETGTCEDCGEIAVYDQMHREALTANLICNSCREDHYVHSDYYDAIVHLDHERTAYDRDGEEVTIDERDNDFYYSAEHDEYRHRSTRDRGVIRDYHASKNYFVPIADDWTRENNRLLGIELEVEVVNGDRNDAAKKIHDNVNGNEFGHRVFFERDGSLSNGFEIITQPMSLPIARETFGFLKDSNMIRNLRSHRTSTCGLHVHVSRTGLSNVQIARAVVFINDPRNDAFITALARRYNTGFCNIRDKELATAHLPADRYEAVNLTCRNTIEFRIFRGSLKYDAVIAAVEFCHALLNFCAVIEQTAYQLNARDFLAWCAVAMPNETETMRDYIAQRTSGLFQVTENAA